MPRWETRDYSELAMPPEVERAWAAGLWDGEGSTSLKRSRSDAPARFIRMYLSQKDTGPGILLRLQAILGVGKVSERGTRPGVWQWTCNDREGCTRPGVWQWTCNDREGCTRPGVWQWTCNDREGCTRALDVMWPYLSEPKRTQAERAGYVTARG